MSTSLTFEDHVDALNAAGSRLGTLAVDSGLSTPVPTCPAWTNRDLLAHQAMVHRWAASHVLGDNPSDVPDQTKLRTVEDLPAYYSEGHRALLAALRQAPADLDAMTFLKDAPPPRDFWARRQAHETTIHMVDALAASFGRLPRADEAKLDPVLAIDGIDELLRGFFTRGRSKLYDGEEYTIAVAPDDVDRRWFVHVTERLTVEPGHGPAAETADVRVTGGAVALYLGLWNRGDELEAEGRPSVLDEWRARQRVTWS